MHGLKPVRDRVVIPTGNLKSGWRWRAGYIVFSLRRTCRTSFTTGQTCVVADLELVFSCHEWRWWSSSDKLIDWLLAKILVVGQINMAEEKSAQRSADNKPSFFGDIRLRKLQGTESGSERGNGLYSWNSFSAIWNYIKLPTPSGFKANPEDWWDFRLFYHKLLADVSVSCTYVEEASLLINKSTVRALPLQCTCFIDSRTEHPLENKLAAR